MHLNGTLKDAEPGQMTLKRSIKEETELTKNLGKELMKINWDRDHWDAVIRGLYPGKKGRF